MEKDRKVFDESWYVKAIEEFINKYHVIKEDFDVKDKNFSSLEDVRKYLSNCRKKWNKMIKSVDIAHISIILWNYYREKQKNSEIITKEIELSTKKATYKEFLDLSKLPQVSVKLSDIAMGSFEVNSLKKNKILAKSRIKSSDSDDGNDLTVPIAVRKSPRKNAQIARKDIITDISKEKWSDKKIKRLRDLKEGKEEINKKSKYDMKHHKCYICGKKRVLMTCTNCKKKFHLKCLNLPLKNSSKNSVYCRECNDNSDDEVSSVTYGKSRRNSSRIKSKKIYYADESSNGNSTNGSFNQVSDNASNNNSSDDDSSINSYLLKSDDFNDSSDQLSDEKSSALDNTKRQAHQKIKKVCKVCKDIHHLVQCPRCKISYHLKCMLPPLKHIPTGSWCCFLCETKRYSKSIESILFWRFVKYRPTERQLRQGCQEKEYKTRSFFVKFYGECYWRCRWISETYLKYFHPTLYSGYKKKNSLDNEPDIEDGYKPLSSSWEPDETHDYSDSNLEDRYYRFGVKPSWLEVDRICNEKIKKGKKKYLIKWSELNYEKCTWEYQDAPYFKAISDNFHDALKRYLKHKKELKKRNKLLRRPTPEYIAYNQQPNFLPNNYNLQGYQIHGVNWLRYSWHSNTNCILADEMGLGKTIQTIVFLYSLYKEGKDVGPFLVSAPLSTVPNWEREFSMWAPDLYVVTYTGGKENRTVIKTLDFCNGFNSKRQIGSSKYRFHVLLTSFEMIYVDSTVLGGINWSVLVVDEAHRLKNSQSKYFKHLSRFKIGYKLLLTGTPLQNNLEELYHLLLFLSPKDIEDKESFLSRFEDISKENQIVQLQSILGPRLLRRLKKDVLKDLPSKSETIIRIDMSTLQKYYYKAVLTKNYKKFASKSCTSSSLMNVVMELKKCCNHPYLFAAAFEEAKRDKNGDLDADTFIQASGKFVVLEKMLKKLKETNHRVLIFSQMTKMLDLLEDFLDYFDFTYERIDGSVNTTSRQQSIDRFNSPESNIFCFLLSTRAGGFGINLATADTVFIFDSDWNPHNDIQAFSRAHRIGQLSKVMVYRFVTRNSVEERIIQVAKRKMMLTHLVVRSGGLGDKSVCMSKRELDDILKFGTDDLFKEESTEDNSLKIVYDDKAIDDLLDRDKKQTGDDVGEGSVFNEYFGSFKVANYSTAHIEGDEEVDSVKLNEKDILKKNDPDYWYKLLGDLVNESVVPDETSEFGKGKRVRKNITYYDVDAKDSNQVDSDFTFSTESETSSDIEDEAIENNNEPSYTLLASYLQKINSRSSSHVKSLSSLSTHKSNELGWKDINCRTIRLINMAIFRYGLPPVSYIEMKNRWCPVGLKTKPEAVVRAYIQALVEYLFSSDLPKPVAVAVANLSDESQVVQNMQHASNTTATAIMSKSSSSSSSSANVGHNSDEYNFKDINKEHIIQRIAVMDLIRDKIFEYMRFLPYLYPILVSEGLVSIDKLSQPYPSSVRLKRRQNALSNECFIEVYDISKCSYDYIYPNDTTELEELEYSFLFNIEECGNTDIHYVWAAEENQKNSNIWWRFHDMWLLLGTAIHGYGKLNEIFNDTRLNALNIPFRHHEGSRNYKNDFVMRRLKLLEQALLAERAHKIAKIKKLSISQHEFSMNAMNSYYRLRTLLNASKNMVDNITPENRNDSCVFFTILKEIYDLIEGLGRNLSLCKNQNLTSDTFSGGDFSSKVGFLSKQQQLQLVKQHWCSRL